MEPSKQYSTRRAKSLGIEAKPEAMAFVYAVMIAPRALRSPDFQVAMDLCSRFEISAQDMLEHRRERAK